MPDGEISEAITNTVRTVAEEGKKPFARNILDSEKSLLLFNNRDIRTRSFAHLRSGSRTSEQIIPKPTDVYKMASTAGTFSLRDKALILCLFQSGVRTSCMTRWTYGLVKGSLYPSLNLPVPLGVTPALDTKLPSYGLNYFVTFLGKEAAEALRDYLEERKRGGWDPHDSDLVFVTAGTTPGTRGKHLAVSHLDEVIKRVAKRSGLGQMGIWPYCLGKSFRKVINNAPIDEDTKEALMGHTPPNSRTNYFDYRDLHGIARKYELASFSMDVGSQFDALIARMDRVEAGLGTEINDLRELLQRLQFSGNVAISPAE